MHHLSIKISACVVGIALWFFVSLNRLYQKEYSFPLRFENLPAHLALEYLPPDSIHLLVEGKGWDLISLDPQETPVKINMSHANLGDTSIALVPRTFENQAISRDLKVLRILSSRNLFLTIEPKLLRRSPVSLDLEVLPKEGYVVVNSFESNPSEVEISGGRREIARTLNIPTFPFKVSNLSKDTVLTVPLQNPSPRGLNLMIDSIEVKVEVQKLGSRTFENFPVALIPPGARKDFILSPQTATLTLRGGEENLSKLTQTDLYLFIENSRFEIEGKAQLPPSLRFPPEVLSYSVEPETFERKILSGDSTNVLSGN